MAHYHIIENTPGYLPDSDPYIVDTEEEAREAIKDIVSQWEEERSQLEDETEDISTSDDGLSAWMDSRSDYMHDLGRVASAELCLDAECEWTEE